MAKRKPQVKVSVNEYFIIQLQQLLFFSSADSYTSKCNAYIKWKILFDAEDLYLRPDYLLLSRKRLF